jgi:hypothetical protein
MGQLVFQATLGGQVNLVGPNTASTFNLNVPAVSATLATTAANTFTAVQTFSAGSAGTPAITTSGDTNTGIFFPAADTIAFSEGGTESMRIDSSGNLGIGTTSPAGKVHSFSASSGATASGNANQFIAENSGNAGITIATGASSLGNIFFADSGDNADGFVQYDQSGRSLRFGTATSEKMRLDASGNLGVGVTSPAAYLSLKSAATSDKANSLRLFDATGTNGNNYGFGMNTTTGEFSYTAGTGGYHAWYTSNTERARIDSSGNLLVGTTTAVAGAVLVASKSVADYAVRFINSNATPFGLVLNYSGAAPNSTSAEFLRCVDSSADRMLVRSNGGIANYSANNVNLSDERTKTDIQNAGGYLAKICSIPVRTFKYKDQTDNLLNLGVIAQEVEAVAPELVDASGFGETPEDGVPLKAIYQTDLQYALMKCIQEQQALITQLQADVAALKA